MVRSVRQEYEVEAEQGKRKEGVQWGSRES